MSFSPTAAEQEFLAAWPENTAPEARENFACAGLPNRRVESWHYSDLRAKLRVAPEIAGAPDAASLDFLRARLVASDRLKIVIVDGFYVAELSDDFSQIPGVDIVSAGGDDFTGLGEDALLDLNEGLSRGGFVLDIAPGARFDRAIEILALSGAQGDRSRFGRSLIRLAAGARASVIETRDEGAAGFGDSALFIALGEEAQLDYACRSIGGAGVDVQTVVATLAARSKLRAVSLIAQTPFLRRQYFVSLAGEGAELHLAGATVLRGVEQSDTTLVVRHDAPHGLSRETFKYVLDDRANGVFQGKITAPPHAQKTDGKMLCRGLLLSDDASLSAKPELEIFADDVACGHGAAVAKLDPQQLFYMEARGIPRAEAEKILIEAFAAEIFDTVESETLRDLLKSDLSRLLGGGAA